MKIRPKFAIAKLNRRFFLTATGSFVTSLIFASCRTTGSQSPTTTSTTTSTTANTSPAAPEKNTLKVGVWFFVAEDILKFIQENLASSENLKIQIVKFNDWILPNTALRDREIDANLFQNRPFMQDSAKKLKVNLVQLNLCYLTPMGIYSNRHKSLSTLPSEARIAIPSDATNGDRGLKLLAANGLLQLKDTPSGLATVKDITKNPKNLQIKEIEGPTLARAIDDLDLSVFATSVRLQAGLNLQPLVQESAAAKRYAVGLVTLQGKENDPRIQQLNRLINHPKVRDFIQQKYQGSVLAVF